MSWVKQAFYPSCIFFFTKTSSANELAGGSPLRRAHRTGPELGAAANVCFSLRIEYANLIYLIYISFIYTRYISKQLFLIQCPAGVSFYSFHIISSSSSFTVVEENHNLHKTRQMKQTICTDADCTKIWPDIWVKPPASQVKKEFILYQLTTEHPTPSLPALPTPALSRVFLTITILSLFIHCMAAST